MAKEEFERAATSPMPETTNPFVQKKKMGKLKLLAGVGILTVAAAIGMNMLGGDEPNPAKERLTAIHTKTTSIIDDFAINMADISDPSRAGQYRNDLEANLEQLLLEAMIHDENEVKAPLQTSASDLHTMRVAQAKGIKVVFDDQLTEYGAVYHPKEKVIAINANVPLKQAAIYARNALHHISFAVLRDGRMKLQWPDGKRPEGAQLMMENYFAVSSYASEKGNVAASILHRPDLPDNFKPPAPPIKRGPSAGS